VSILKVVPTGGSLQICTVLVSARKSAFKIFTRRHIWSDESLLIISNNTHSLDSGGLSGIRCECD